MKKIVSIFCLSIICAGKLTAQQLLECGTKVTQPPLLVDYSRLQQQTLLYTAPYQVRLFIHICANDDGSNLAVTNQAALMLYLEKTRDHYAAHNICFSLSGIDTVRNTLLNNCIIDDEFTQDRLQNNSLGGSMNVFFHRSLNNSDGDSYAGQAYNIGSAVCSIRGNVLGNVNSSTLTHELGHCFGLYHTFETAFGTEKVARNGSQSNCTSAGDLLCDTQADPNSPDYNMAFYINAACQYTGNKKDTHGNTYDPPIRNLMAYGSDQCKDEFTPQQRNKMQAVITSTHQLLLNEDDFTFTQNATWVNSVLTLSARNTYTIAPSIPSSTSFVLTGANQAHIVAGNYIDLKPGTQLKPTSSSGFMELRLNTLCN